MGNLILSRIDQFENLQPQDLDSVQMSEAHRGLSLIAMGQSELCMLWFPISLSVLSLCYLQIGGFSAFIIMIPVFLIVGEYSFEYSCFLCFKHFFSSQVVACVLHFVFCVVWLMLMSTHGLKLSISRKNRMILMLPKAVVAEIEVEIAQLKQLRPKVPQKRTACFEKIKPQATRNEKGTLLTNVIV